MNNLLTKDIDEFNTIIYDIANHPTVQKMKLFRQHYDTSCFDHCYDVAYYSFIICKKLHLDYTSAARARNVTRFIFVRLESKTARWKKISWF